MGTTFINYAKYVRIIIQILYVLQVKLPSKIKI
jgi:hypothetical protein